MSTHDEGFLAGLTVARVSLGALALGVLAAPLLHARAMAQGGGALAVAGATQDGESPERAELERLWKALTTGRTVVRPQAAQRLLRQGPEAEAFVLEQLGDEPLAALAEAGTPLVEALGLARGDALHGLLWRALTDPDFPWRASAARAAAGGPRETDASGLVGLLIDPLSQVRAAAVQGLGTLELDAEARVRPLLSDPDDGVRRAAASYLAGRGDARALAWLLEDLRRTDRFFERPTGLAARVAAARLLEEHLGDLHGFQASREPDEPANATALAAIQQDLVLRLAPDLSSTHPHPLPVLPEVARASGPEPDERLGLELRSCRKGEFFLRWTGGDELLVGQGHAARVALPAGSVTRLLEATGAALDALGDKRSFGEPGCDVEQYLVRLDGEERTRVLLLSKGPAPRPDLRPMQLDRLAAELLATLPDGTSPDPRLDRLRSRATAALESLGGPLGE